MPDETELNTPPEGGDVVEDDQETEVPPEEDGEKAPPEEKPSGEEKPPEEKPEKTVSYEDHENLQARLAYAERQLKRKEREPEPKPEIKPEPVPDAQKPTEDAYEDYNDYIEALTSWKTNSILKARDEKNELQSVEGRRIDRDRKVDAIVSTEIAKDSDFLKKAFIPIGMEDLVIDSDQFVEIALYFGKNPDEAMRLLDMPALQAAREIGKIEANLQTKTPQRTKTVAPTPTKTVGGNEIVEKKLHDMTTAEHIAYMNKREFGGETGE
jgi:hypothetical protein